jgi:GTPase Era involved in 16S rRNA processing
MIEKALKMIKKLEKNGFVVETKNGLKFLVDYLNERRKEGIPLRVDAVFASGYDGVIVYDENKESYFINLHPELPHHLRVKIEGGINVRGKMFIRDASDKEPLKVSLKKILEAVGVDFSKLTDNLKKAIEKNEEWMKILIFDASQIEKVDDEWRLGNGVIENLPQNFLPKKGTKIYLRKIDKREKNKYFLKVVKIEEKKEEKVLKFVVPINKKNGFWEAELPNGLKVKLPEGEYDPNHFYQIVIKFNPDGKNEILEILKRGKIK